MRKAHFYIRCTANDKAKEKKIQSQRISLRKFQESALFKLSASFFLALIYALCLKW